MYVDAFINRKKDILQVAERINGKRIYREIPLVYEFFSEDARGTTPSITGVMTRKHTFSSSKAMKDAMAGMSGITLFESDVNPLFKTLAANYRGEASPELHTCFFDIETDFDRVRGYAPVDDPFNRVTAISFYRDWIKDDSKLVVLVLKPRGMSQLNAEMIVATLNQENEGVVILCETEVQMLNAFLDLIEDADVISGWNSEVYDVPYLVNRIRMVMSEADTNRFCLWNEKPRPRTVDNYGKDVGTYEFVGRIHMDFMDLYKKHAGQVEQSYALDYIGGKVTGEHKVPYTGSLDVLYNEDFANFIRYSRQDTHLLFKMNKKLDYINLHNRLAHQECVLISTTMGSVALLETAVINEIHEWGEVVFDKRERLDTDGAAGAWVQDPVTGLHEEIGLIDLNSLYPSAIRSLSMSTERIIGQIRQTYTQQFIDERIEKQRMASRSRDFKPDYAEAWHPLFASIEHTMVMSKSPDPLVVDMEDGSSFETTGAELYDIIFAENSTIVISANGTLFDRSKRGVIPAILTRWYTERQLMQRAVIDCKHLAGKSSIEEERGYSTEQMESELNGFTRREWLAQNEPSMKLEQRDDGKWYAVDSDYAAARGAYWKMMQQIRKILLNSLYGALLNKHCRFYDKRLGQSVTLTGRSITKHMASTINEVLTGTYDHTGGVIIYGDTDSVMFSAKKKFQDEGVAFDWDTRENVIDLYLKVGEKVSESFPAFMHRTFNTGLENGRIIDAGLEIVGSRGLFLKKKRYGILKYWEDGFRLDTKGKPGSLKAMGVEIKRSDTPKYIQVFLEDLLISLLTGASEESLREKVKAFKRTFRDKPAWTKGTPKTVKNLTNKKAEFDRTGKCSTGHALAAIHWNNMREMMKDVSVSQIEDGGKTIVCKLKMNPYRIDSIGFPVELMDNLPEWFTSLPFDVDEMEKTILSQKLGNLFGILNMDLAIEDNMNTTIDSDMFGW